MKILVVGGGGREHALAWKIAQSAQVEHIYVAPGNAGTAFEPKMANIDISADDLNALLDFAKRNSIDLTLVGPEIPLVNGITDLFQAAGLRIFGPSKAAAQLEGSKAFAKDFMARHKIPTATYRVFSDPEEALTYLHQQQLPIVIKADGLAAGKGVVIAHSEQQAVATVENMLSGNAFGDAGHRVVIEEFLQGEEASFIVMSDGKHILPMASSQDHKARDDGDCGPNTGGMGAYSPAPIVTTEVYERIMNEIIYPTIDGLASDGYTYVGFLYAGLMITDDGIPKVLEFNCRFGDPETQPVMMRLKSDLLDLCYAALNGKLNQCSVEWDQRAAVGVVMAAGGYPEHYTKGLPIHGLMATTNERLKVFHAGTKQQEGAILTNGGRVLCVTALGNSVSAAQTEAYNTVQQIHWEQVYYRKDIGYKAILRENLKK